ncbi:hypothetical protein ACFQY7_41150 [Actinomadura luteofluorescens]|uniref:hypothetical protein n=1 Tax=Actinomadura luteofluorescens TaxID=46163 RepID=UPI00363DBE83
MSTESRSDASTAPVLNMTFFLPFGADVSANNFFERDLLSIGGRGVAVAGVNNRRKGTVKGPGPSKTFEVEAAAGSRTDDRALAVEKCENY